MAGAVGNAILFFMSLIATVILGSYTLAYAAHCVLTVIDGTAAGADDVDWPDEPILDWLWKFVYLLWLVMLWLVPVLFISRWLLHTLPPAAALPRILASFALLFWLLFPISMLSSLSATSRWVIFSASLLPRLAQRPGAVVMFYLVTGPLLAAGAVAAGLLVWFGPGLVVPVAGFGVAVVLLIYARLFGRLAQLIRFTRDPESRPRPAARGRPRVAPQVQAAAYDPLAAGARVVQPSDLPPVNAPDPDARVGYNVRLDPDPQHAPEASRRWRPVDPDDEPTAYDLADGPPAQAPPRGPLPERIVNPSEYELALARGGRQPRPVSQPWTSGVWSFPFYAAVRGPLVWLTFGFSATGIFVRLMASFYPG